MLLPLTALQLGLPIYAKQGGGDAAADEDDEKVSNLVHWAAFPVGWAPGAVRTRRGW